jgi:hypothetical protein
MTTLHLVSVWQEGTQFDTERRQFVVGNSLNVSPLVKAIHQHVGADNHLARASANNQFPLRYTISKDVTVAGWINTYTERRVMWHIRVDACPASAFVKVTATAEEELKSLTRKMQKTLPSTTTLIN